MRISSRLALVGAFVVAAQPLAAQQQCPVTQGGTMPLKYTGGPTVQAITACDLMTRLYQYADDSMMGRAVGTEHHLRATAWLAEQLKAIGIKPAGTDGFFQNIGVVARAFDTTASTLTIAGTSYKAGTDFVAVTGGKPHAINAADVVVWGTALDTIGNPTLEQVKGKYVVVKPLTAAPPGFNPVQFQASAGFQRLQAMQTNPAIAGLLTISAGDLTPAQIRNALNPTGNARYTSQDPMPVTLVVSARVGQAILGVPVAEATVGMTGKNPVTLDARFVDVQKPGRNVVAMIPGTDPKLRNEYVLLGAHNDHVGFDPRMKMDHDSAKAFNMVFREQGADTRTGPEQLRDSTKWARVNRLIDSLRKERPGTSRPDSITNGADDDGSGTVALLEIAEAFQKGTVKPKRSLLFVWHAGEEMGMWGSDYFAAHPTVARESISAAINMDMVGRGFASDITGDAKDGGKLKGGDGYLQLVGSRRLSKEYGDLVETVNTEKKLGFTFDYNIDADGHPQNIYCRSDHWSYAKWGIPVVFFTTGGHADYHQVTDEAQYINYTHMTDVSKLAYELALRAGNLAQRVKLDKAGPFDPNVSCRQ